MVSPYSAVSPNRTAHKKTPNPNLPVINYGTLQEPKYLPAEFCDVIPGQPCNSKLSPDQTSNMINFAVRNPCENANSIVTKGLSDVVAAGNNLLQHMQISVASSLVKVNGRILQVPNLSYPENRTPIRPINGSWSPRQVQKLGCPGNWPAFVVLILYDRQCPDGDVQTAMPSLIQQAGQWGIRCGPHQGNSKHAIDRNNLERSAEQALVRTVNSHPSAGLVLVVLPEANTQLYSGIKRQGDTKLGVHTVFIVGNKNKLFRPMPKNASYFSNVVIKMNLKLGGTNQKIADSDLGIISEGTTMVVGIDVTHPSPGSSASAPSIAAMVASVDKTLSQWPAVLRVQNNARNEMVDDLKEMLKSRLVLWRERNQKLPMNILVYRDGVSEGQYDVVLQNELPRLRDACNEMYTTNSKSQDIPKISIIIVGKRHNTRFYPTNEAHTDNSSNSLAGTIADRGITEHRNL